MIYGKHKLLILAGALALAGCGCGRSTAEESAAMTLESPSQATAQLSQTLESSAWGIELSDEEESSIYESNTQNSGTKDAVIGETLKIAEYYRDIYEKAIQENTLGSPQVQQAIISCLGNKGYAAVDTENQIDMVNPDQAERFCAQAAGEQDGEATILTVMENGGFIRHDLETSRGEMTVTRIVLNWDNGVPDISYKNSYPAYSWTYSDNGYLFFDEYCPPGYDGPPGYTAIRIKPLEKTLRELNRRFLLPVGYELNNMFTSDWSEKDFGDLNFYDLYERFYRMEYGKEPYGSTIDSGTYQVPEDIFEAVFKTCFRIDSRTLRRNTVYLAEEKAYQYRTRG